MFLRRGTIGIDPKVRWGEFLTVVLASRAEADEVCSGLSARCPIFRVPHRKVFSSVDVPTQPRVLPHIAFR